MALAIEFAMPSSKFNPTKYAPKSSRSTNVIKSILAPKAQGPATTSSTQKLDANESANSFVLSAVKEGTLETTTFLTKTPSSIEISHTTTELTVTEKNAESDSIPKATIGQLKLVSAPGQACAKSGNEEAEIFTILDVKVEEQASLRGPEVETVKPGSEDIQPRPSTLITAENCDLNLIPAPDDAESTDTRRLVGEWTCMVPSRHAYREGELVIYIAVDAFLPSANRRFGNASSLQTYDGDLGHSVKTKHFGSYPDKLVVQGCIYTIKKSEEIFQEIRCIRQVMDNVLSEDSSHKVEAVICAMYRDEDWAAKIGVKKWEEPKPADNPNKHLKLGAVPNRVFRKTDIALLEKTLSHDRLTFCDCPKLLTERKYFTNEYQESINIDGASMTVYFVRKTSRSYHNLRKLPEEVGPDTVLENRRFGVTSKSIDLNKLSTSVFDY